MSEKIVLIDGHSILNRAFYGLPDLTNSEGLHTNAVYGFLNIMTRILEEEKPQYLTWLLIYMRLPSAIRNIRRIKGQEKRCRKS